MTNSTSENWNALLSFLDNEKENFSVIEEAWDYLKLECKNRDAIGLVFLQKLLILIDSIRNTKVVIKVDDKSIELEELKVDYNSNIFYKKWACTIPKSIIILEQQETKQNFFIDHKFFIAFLDLVNPFDPDSKFNYSKSIKIYLLNYSNMIRGNAIEISGFKYQSTSRSFFSNTLQFIPSDVLVAQNVYFLTSESNYVNPLHFFITSVDHFDEIAKKCLFMSTKILSVAIVDEFHSKKKVVLNGVRKITLDVAEELDLELINVNFYTELCNVINWVYEERITTRKRLFLDRLTLEADKGHSLLKNLYSSNADGLAQAKERYNFIILERKDQYSKELNALLKDVKSQSELYSGKIRTLLNNLLRDALAGFVLIGFTLFTKVSDVAQLSQAHLLKYVFTALGTYYVVSAIFQLIIDVVDMTVSKKEIFYWENVTKELIPRKEFEQHVQRSLKNRTISIWVIYPLLILIYFFIAVVCFYFISNWKSFLL